MTGLTELTPTVYYGILSLVWGTCAGFLAALVWLAFVFVGAIDRKLRRKPKSKVAQRSDPVIESL